MDTGRGRNTDLAGAGDVRVGKCEPSKSVVGLEAVSACHTHLCVLGLVHDIKTCALRTQPLCVDARVLEVYQEPKPCTRKSAVCLCGAERACRGRGLLRDPFLLRYSQIRRSRSQPGTKTCTPERVVYFLVGRAGPLMPPKKKKRQDKQSGQEAEAKCTACEVEHVWHSRSRNSVCI